MPPGSTWRPRSKDITAITGRIDLVHCNNSRDEAGSGRDRHAPLADGEIETQALIDIVQAAGAPVILETPGRAAESGPRRSSCCARASASSRHTQIVPAPEGDGAGTMVSATEVAAAGKGCAQSSISKVRRTEWFPTMTPSGSNADLIVTSRPQVTGS